MSVPKMGINFLDECMVSVFRDEFYTRPLKDKELLLEFDKTHFTDVSRNFEFMYGYKRRNRLKQLTENVVVFNETPIEYNEKITCYCVFNGTVVTETLQADSGTFATAMHPVKGNYIDACFVAVKKAEKGFDITFTDMYAKYHQKKEYSKVEKGMFESYEEVEVITIQDKLFYFCYKGNEWRDGYDLDIYYANRVHGKISMDRVGSLNGLMKTSRFIFNENSALCIVDILDHNDKYETKPVVFTPE